MQTYINALPYELREHLYQLYHIVYSPVYKQPVETVHKILQTQPLSQSEIDYLVTTIVAPDLPTICGQIPFDDYQTCIVLQRCLPQHLLHTARVLRPCTQLARKIVLLRTPPNKSYDMVSLVDTLTAADHLFAMARTHELVATFRISTQTPLSRWFALTQCSSKYDYNTVWQLCKRIDFNEREALFQRHGIWSIMETMRNDIILTNSEYRRILRMVRPKLLAEVLGLILYLTPDLIKFGCELGAHIHHIEWSWFIDNRVVILRNISSFDEFAQLGIPWSTLTLTERSILLHRCCDIFNIGVTCYDLTPTERLILYRKCNRICLISFVDILSPVTPLERATLLISCPRSAQSNLISRLGGLTPNEELLMTSLNTDCPHPHMPDLDRTVFLLFVELTLDNMDTFGSLTQDERELLLDCHSPHNMLPLLALFNNQDVPPTMVERATFLETVSTTNLVKIVEALAPLSPIEIDIAIDRCPRTELHTLCKYTTDAARLHTIYERATPQHFDMDVYLTLPAPWRQFIRDCYPIAISDLAPLGKELLPDEKIDMLRHAPPKQIPALLNDSSFDFTEREYAYGILICHPKFVHQITCQKWPQFRIWTLYLCTNLMCWVTSHQNITHDEYELILRTCTDHAFNHFYNYCSIPHLGDKIRAQRGKAI